MRLTALAGVFLCVAIFAANSPEAHAEIDSQKLALGEIQVSEVMDEQINLDDIVKPDQPKAKKLEYVIKPGDELTKIAKDHNTTWQRIFAKNTNISDPNVITVGEKIIIPDSKEKLSDRALSTDFEDTLDQKQPKQHKTVDSQTSVSYSARGSSAGNTYTPGYCTYYAKQRRPDLPNNLGNASSWVARARAQGIPTGSTPRAGAIGQQGNHVVYVERVNGNGTITISDMNWGGRWKITTRTVPANSHVYIY